MSQLVVALVAGLSLGAIFVLVALGMVLAFRATHTFNFAHGQFMLIPALVVGSGLPFSRSFTVSGLVGLALVACIGALFYVFVLQRTTGFMSTIATLGLAAALNGVIQLAWSGRTYSIAFPHLPTGVVTIFGARVASADLVRTALTLVLVAAVAVGLRYTNQGRRIRLAGQDALLASQSGVNVRAVHLASWAGAAALAGVAGIVYGSTTLVDPTLVALALSAAPAMVIGGLDSIPGAVVGGIVVGLLQAFVATYVDTSLTQVASYVALLVVILVLPHGILGTRTMSRV